jgi:hypothetical protein
MSGNASEMMMYHLLLCVICAWRKRLDAQIEMTGQP